MFERREGVLLKTRRVGVLKRGGEGEGDLGLQISEVSDFVFEVDL